MGLQRLSADDRLILWPDAIWPQDVGVLGLLGGGGLRDPAGRFRLDLARDVVAARIHRVPRLRQLLYRPRFGLGGPLWIDDQAFDVARHVRTVPVPAPGDERSLLHTVEQLRRHRLDAARPLWEMWFLTGLEDERIGWFVRLHHVVADGIAGVADLAALLDRDPEADTSPAPWTPVPPPAARDLLVDHLRGRSRQLVTVASALGRPAATLASARAVWPAVRSLLTSEPGPRTSLDRVIGTDRTFAVVRSSLSSVLDLAHRHHATVNDVLLAVTAGGLRALLRSRGEPVDGLTLPIYVPVSLRGSSPEPRGGNLIGQMIVHLPVGTPDLAARLQRIARETAELKTQPRPSLGTLFANRLLRAAMLRLIVRQRVNVVSADLPGPPTPASFAGGEVLELFPVVNLVGNESLGVGALSYAGRFAVLAVGDAAAHPDLPVLAAAMQAELETLSAAVSARSSPSSTPPAARAPRTR